MQLTKPEIKRVHVTVYEKGVRGTQTFTVYGSSTEEVARELREHIAAKAKDKNVAQPAGAT